MEIKDARFIMSNSEVENVPGPTSRNMHLLAGRMWVSRR
jgi:hypothetical protein